MLQLEDIVDLILDAWEDDGAVERQLPSLMQMLKICREKQLEGPPQYVPHQPQNPYNPGQQFPVPMQPLVDPIAKARAAPANHPDFILDPTNPNSKAMRGRARKSGAVRVKNGSGAAFEDPELPLE